MTMFEELYALAASATLTMVISADDKSGRMTINVIPKPKKDVDEPALTKALSLTATPEEICGACMPQDMDPTHRKLVVAPLVGVFPWGSSHVIEAPVVLVETREPQFRGAVTLDPQDDATGVHR